MGVLKMGSLIVPKKVERGTLLLQNACKKLAHTDRFELETSELKRLSLDQERLNCATCRLKRVITSSKKHSFENKFKLSQIM